VKPISDEQIELCDAAVSDGDDYKHAPIYCHEYRALRERLRLADAVVEAAERMADAMDKGFDDIDEGSFIEIDARAYGALAAVLFAYRREVSRD
jgi:hypothetical protein